MNDVLVSSITFWEISLKYPLGKLDLQGISPDDFPKLSHETGFGYLPLMPAEAAGYQSLKANWHRDPFDRMLIWQAISNDLTLLSKDNHSPISIDRLKNNLVENTNQYSSS